jgi:hypothetical protein
MRGVRASRAWMVRLAALLGLGALVVHQLRYLVGYGDSAQPALDGPRHAYLMALGPVLAGLAVIVLAELMGRAARGGAVAPRFRQLWSGSSVALLAVYCVQETAEGASLTAHGGWLAVPLAALVGLGIAALMRSTTRPAPAPGRPWRAPSPRAWAPLATAELGCRARTGAPRTLTARGPPSTPA